MVKTDVLHVVRTGAFLSHAIYGQLRAREKLLELLASLFSSDVLPLSVFKNIHFQG